ncbi:hypothetical protein XH93_18070 [Bradyrhizobium sp. CCBAU 51753]|nr:hypothetical protein XH93_18070 [Bradyrhizobium sp. CCBAU 51753]
MTTKTQVSSGSRVGHSAVIADDASGKTRMIPAVAAMQATSSIAKVKLIYMSGNLDGMRGNLG